MPPEARDHMADFASRCEGKGPAWRVDGTSVAVRLEWREAKGMSAVASGSLAHMSLALHDTFRFTDACAVDGSFLRAEGRATSDVAAWAWWRGLDEEGRPMAAGGALRGAVLL